MVSDGLAMVLLRQVNELQTSLRTSLTVSALQCLTRVRQVHSFRSQNAEAFHR